MLGALLLLMAPFVLQAPAAHAVPTWWDANYSHRLGITLQAGSALPTSYSVSVTFDHAAAVSAGASLSNGDDVRIARWNGSSWTELDRIVDPAAGWNSATTKIWFRTQTAISAGAIDSSYYLYYGNGSASSPPSTGSNVFVFYDDFNGGALNGSNWTVDSYGGGLTATQTGGELKIAGTTSMMGGGITSVGTYGPDVMIEGSARIVTQSANAHDNYQMCLTPSYWDCIYSNASSTKGVQWNNFGPWTNQGASTLQAQTFGYHRLGIALTSSSTVSWWEDGVKVVSRSTSTGAININLNYHPFVAATVDARFDDVWVRKYVSSEPLLVLDGVGDVPVSATVLPELTFGVAAHAGACNGIAQSAGAQVGSRAVTLPSMGPGASRVGAQDLTASTNAGTGFTVAVRAAALPSYQGNGHVLAAVSGTNAAPGTFPAPGTEAIGYTTSDSALGGASPSRFTSPSAAWAALTTSDAPVMYATGSTAKAVCVAFQAAASAATPAGTYRGTVVYTIVPIF